MEFGVVLFCIDFSVCDCQYTSVYLALLGTVQYSATAQCHTTNQKLMATSQKTPSIPPQKLALYGTAMVVIILAGVSTGAYFLGRNSAPKQTTLTATNTAAEVATITAASTGSVTSGVLQKITNSTITMTIGSGDQQKIATYAISGATVYRKFDYRTLPKNGFGDGTPIVLKDLHTGANIVVYADTGKTDTPSASKVNFLIYP